MVAKLWKKVLFVILIIACLFNIVNKLSFPFLIISIITAGCLIFLNISYFIFNYQLRKGEKKNGKA